MIKFTCSVSGSIIERLTCLASLDSAALLTFKYQQLYLFGLIQTSQTGGQAYSDTSLSHPTGFLNCVRSRADNLIIN